MYITRSYSTKAWINGYMDIYYIYVIFSLKHKMLFCLIYVALITEPVCTYKNRIKVYNACLSNVQQSKKNNCIMCLIVLRPCYFLERMLWEREIEKKYRYNETISAHLSINMYIMCIDHNRLKLVDKQLVRYCIKFVIWKKRFFS